VALAVVGVIALVGGQAATFFLMLALAIAACGELFALARTNATRPSALVGLVGVTTLLLIGLAKGEQAPPLFPAAIAGTFGGAFLEVLLRQKTRRKEATRAVAFTVAPVMVTGLLAAYVVALRTSRQGAQLAGGLVIMWAVAEAAMALYARKKPLGEDATPAHASRSRQERTGFALVGGFLGGIIVAIAFSDVFGWTNGLVLGVLVGLSTAAGHLVSSMVVEPGEGARALRLVPLIDGLFVSAPVFFYAFRVIGR
jgi:CDP-diglyceride synthetase